MPMFFDLASTDHDALIKALEAAIKAMQGRWVFETGAVTAICGLFGTALSGTGVALWRYVQKIIDREDRVKNEAQETIRKEFKPLIAQRDQQIEFLKTINDKALEAKDVQISNEVERRERAEHEISDLRIEFTNETMPLLREVRDVVSRHGDASIQAVKASVKALEENDRGNARVVEFYQAIQGLPRALERIERILKEKTDA